MKFVLLICCLAQLPFLIVVIYDFVTKELHNLWRYHIGRWADETQWAEAVKNCAKKWLLNPPVVSSIDESQYRLVKKLKGQAISATIQSWQNAGLSLGVQTAANTPQEKELLRKWEQQL